MRTHCKNGHELTPETRRKDKRGLGKCGICKNSAVKDESGKVYGQLTVLRSSDQKLYGSKQQFWECQCTCGKLLTIPGANLRKGNSTRCSDCRHAMKRRIGSSASYLFSEYRAGAKDRGIGFDITPEFFREITKKNCHFCGIEPKQVRDDRPFDVYVYNGIDRYNNTLGYIESNCVPCCKVCNISKRAMSVEDFMAWVKRIYEHSYGKIAA